MLLAGRVEAACLPEPCATMAASKGAHRLAESDGMGTTPGEILFTKKALAQKGSETVAFSRAYHVAVDEVNANPQDLSRGHCHHRLRFPARCQQPDADPAIPSCIPSRGNTGQRCVCMDETERAREQNPSLRRYRRAGICNDGCSHSISVQLTAAGTKFRHLFAVPFFPSRTGGVFLPNPSWNCKSPVIRLAHIKIQNLTAVWLATQQKNNASELPAVLTP